ncbi:hypothetical protein RR48_06390 [Papilio machaon]|uniref:COMM domain-containing protein n=1 Tax=Papilio machaon TaxID=76193 RepID=A0A194R451_PAPMA|nr:hypothetical protein RR48_06390 [Papilio machaon]
MDKLFKIPLLDDFKQVTDDLISNLYNLENLKHAKILSEEDSRNAKEEIKKCILESNFDFDLLNKILESKQYNESKITHFITCCKQRKSELLVSTVMHINSAHGEIVQDFDWLLKLVIGTSDLKTMKYPLLQLLLLTATKTGNKDKRVYDVSKDILDKMINVLEEAINT